MVFYGKDYKMSYEVPMYSYYGFNFYRSQYSDIWVEKKYSFFGDDSFQIHYVYKPFPKVIPCFKLKKVFKNCLPHFCAFVLEKIEKELWA
jgi:hypothetical protein